MSFWPTRMGRGQLGLGGLLVLLVSLNHSQPWPNTTSRWASLLLSLCVHSFYIDLCLWLTLHQHTPHPYTLPTIEKLCKSLCHIGSSISQNGTPPELGPFVISLTGWVSMYPSSSSLIYAFDCRTGQVAQGCLLMLTYWDGSCGRTWEFDDSQWCVWSV